jgi:hypothetical protein
MLKHDENCELSAVSSSYTLTFPDAFWLIAVVVIKPSFCESWRLSRHEVTYNGISMSDFATLLTSDTK